jgi:adenylate kinase
MKAQALIFLGAPGAGKGTQAQEVYKNLGFPHISTGDILRQAVEKQTPLGLAAKAQMEAGELAPDEVVCGIVVERIKEPDCRPGFILDGFPRTLTQAKFLDQMLQAGGRGDPLVFNILVSHEVLMKRLAGRRTCPVDGQIYNIYFEPPKVAGICDRDGAKLYQRADDREEAIRQRLVEYEKQTSPLIDYYRARNLLRDLDGDRDPGVIAKEVLRIVGDP